MKKKTKVVTISVAQLKLTVYALITNRVDSFLGAQLHHLSLLTVVRIKAFFSEQLE